MSCVETVTQLELRLDDVPAGARFFREILALPVRQHDHGGLEVQLAPDLVAQLRPAPPDDHLRVRTGPGTILQIQVARLEGAVAELRRRGATVLVEPVLTDWGTESAFVAGPGDVIIEVYRPVEA